MTTATVETITAAQAEGFYANVMDKIRERRVKFVQQGKQWIVEEGERPDVAVAHVVMGISDWEAAVIFEHLRRQTALAKTDVLLADALAVRLGLVIMWQRIELK